MQCLHDVFGSSGFSLAHLTLRALHASQPVDKGDKSVLRGLWPDITVITDSVIVACGREKAGQLLSLQRELNEVTWIRWCCDAGGWCSTVASTEARTEES